MNTYPTEEATPEWVVSFYRLNPGVQHHDVTPDFTAIGVQGTDCYDAIKNAQEWFKQKWALRLTHERFAAYATKD